VGGILGRVDDMVIVRGVNVYPSAVEEVIRAVGGVAEYQATVTTRGPLTELALVIEPQPEVADEVALARRVATALETAFTLHIPIQLAARGTLPRFEMKARRWTRAGS
jgi:phenylacetate-CoA ligase